MGENLMVGTHKSSNKKFNKGYEETFGIEMMCIGCKKMFYVKDEVAKTFTTDGFFVCTKCAIDKNIVKCCKCGTIDCIDEPILTEWDLWVCGDCSMRDIKEGLHGNSGTS